jgi:hypothetical protein
VLALCGLLLWFTPAQRVFYSIVAVLLALATFNTINYGGFFIGMLLGIIGGALAFAWSQAPGRTGRTERQPDNRPRADGGGLGLVLGKLRPGGRDRTLSIAAVPLALSLLATPAQLTAHKGGPASGCILLILCPSPSPTPTPGKPSPQPGGSSSPAPGSSSSPGTGRPGGNTGGNKSGQGKAGRKKIKRTKAPHGLVASAVPAVLNAGSAKLVGLAYDGVAEVPRSSGGPVQMMKFSLRSVTLTGSPTLTIHQNHSVATTSTSLLSFTGNVVLYATKLSGDLLGVPLTITPSSPLSLVLKLLSPLTQGLTVTMTHVVTDQPVTTSAASTWANFLISVKPA